MARVTRTRVVEAPVGEVWRLISDPYNLPRWWPRTTRVENVVGDGGRRTRWTQVLGTADGRGVRADFRCLSAADRDRYVWEQEIEGTPFERYLKSLRVEIDVRERDGETEVSIAEEQVLKGMSRLGSPLMRRARGEALEEALDGIERALG